MIKLHLQHPPPHGISMRAICRLLAPSGRRSVSFSRLFSSDAAQKWFVSRDPAQTDPPATSKVTASFQPISTAEDSPADDWDGESEAPVEDHATRPPVVSPLPRPMMLRGRKVPKPKTQWECESCGARTSQWWGKCPFCNAANTYKKFGVTSGESEAESGGWLPRDVGTGEPQSLADVNKGVSDLEWRIPLPGILGMEVARVLGGGVVPGSLVLLGGDPGVGKSTLLLQVASLLAEASGRNGTNRVLYVSGEESMEQIKSRADRMHITSADIFLCASTDIMEIMAKVRVMRPRALIVDSVQTIYLQGVSGSAGSLSQVKECTSALLRFAKETKIPILLIGHVTKTGDIAGPRVLEHIVDTVLYLEGERNSSYRLLRSVKNRFGSTDELGVLEMLQSGLEAVLNPTEIFLGRNHCESDVLAGLAVAVILEGSRAFLIEIQALCIAGSSEKRHFNGIQATRADMIISVLMKQAGLKLKDFGIYLNVVTGFKLTETAGDLAVAAAICSSFLEFAIPQDIAFIGEIDLGGELRVVPRIDKRIMAVGKLGFKTCIVPESAVKNLSIPDTGMKVLGCKNLKEVIGAIYPPKNNPI